jgi:hypothetical protein
VVVLGSYKFIDTLAELWALLSIHSLSILVEHGLVVVRYHVDHPTHITLSLLAIICELEVRVAVTSAPIASKWWLPLDVINDWHSLLSRTRISERLNHNSEW